ncbi:PstS family phosphate ABC transporter substrate-binding protein [Roseofilum casamattae]|uniref:Phosphate-binding protein n=1 Tax=Roseofilum casamattae BLCC-M143 TaxID=3022442 RepID=A0ABT7BUP9_9CYAN|nr:PstS family phosphate ABC transporter substrate-binding protein [Roseofilum casamattae]MDJ1182825.1 PstS family phosphate ABC transporter substrate-binding protein [Roseofilum casamattae BLCC-M143]
MKSLRKPLALASIFAVVAATVTLSGSAVKSQSRATVKIDGSSTVFPITEAVAEDFQKANNTRVTVGVSGTGGGFKKFCSNNAAVRTHISNASRPIKKTEQEACKAAGVEYIELPVAYDAITIVVSKKNTKVNDATVAELKKMWEKAGQTNGITKWSQVRSGWPDSPFKLYSPGLDSGTYDYFKEAILGKKNDIRNDFSGSEDDNVLVRGIQNNPNAIGYFGLAYYQANKDKLKALKINGVAPSPTTVNNGSYTPLSRPIYIYVNKAEAKKPEVKAFVDFYLKNAPGLVSEVGYVPLPSADYSKAQTRFQNGQTGRIPLRAGL